MADNALHTYSETTKTSCKYIAVALLLLVCSAAGSAPAAPVRWAGKAVAIVAAFYATYTISRATYSLASDTRSRRRPGVLRNVALSGVLCVALVVLVAAAAF